MADISFCFAWLLAFLGEELVEFWFVYNPIVLVLISILIFILILVFNIDF